MTSFRLGRRIRNSVSLRPLKVILSDKAHRKYILEKSRFIPQKLPAEFQKVVIAMLQILNILVPRITTTNILSEWECQSGKLLHAIMF